LNSSGAKDFGGKGAQFAKKRIAQKFDGEIRCAGWNIYADFR
jgi:hypothetical protein